MAGDVCTVLYCTVDDAFQHGRVQLSTLRDSDSFVAPPALALVLLFLFLVSKAVPVVSCDMFSSAQGSLAETGRTCWLRVKSHGNGNEWRKTIKKIIWDVCAAVCLGPTTAGPQSARPPILTLELEELEPYSLGP